MFGFSAFRKRLGLYSFKLTKQTKFKNPHAMSMQTKQAYKKQGYKGELKIREQERLSSRPFGRLSKTGRFIMDVDKVPFFNIPDLTGFNLKPYVAYSTAKIEPEMYEERKIHLTPEILENIEE